MKKTRIIVLVAAAVVAVTANAALTIQECVAKAEDNYPLIRKYDLLRTTCDIDLAEINSSWLPRIGLSAQVTAQNIVPEFPKTLTGVLQQMGQSIQGLGKIQYRVGLDISQDIWDGGSSSAKRRLARAQISVREATLSTELYGVRQRVENIFFAILLIERQIAQSEATYELLTCNLDRMRAMMDNGVAMQSDVDMVEAQTLTLSQSLSQARSAARGYRHVLGIFIGEDVDEVSLATPEEAIPGSMDCDRPELRLFDERMAAYRASERLSDTAVMPRIGFFAQAYYGYPGFDYFKSMISRDLSFNIVGGIRLLWSVDAFYTRSSKRRSATMKIAETEADKDTFLYNTRLQTASQTAAIEGLRQVLRDDDRIVSLRTNVRRAAEAQLENGVIDPVALLSKITDENTARVSAQFHQIQLLQEIYNLKYTLNQ